MNEPVRVGVLVGSLRRASANRQIATWITEHAPQGSTFELLPVRGLPLFDQDLEDAGDPPTVAALKSAWRTMDGVLVVSPEYNGAVPAVTKNALDWASRPVGEGPIWNRPIAYMVVTPGRSGGARSRELATAVVGVFGGLFPETHGIASFNRVFADGRFTDPEAEAALTAFLLRFVEFVQS